MRQSPVTKFVMAAVIIVMAAYLIYPIILLLILSFNTNRLFLVGAPHWGFANWIHAWSMPGLLVSIWNSFVVWLPESLFSFPIADRDRVVARPHEHPQVFAVWSSCSGSR